jgi:hypothetical protein
MVRFEPQKGANVTGARVTERRRSTPVDVSGRTAYPSSYHAGLLVCPYVLVVLWIFSLGERAVEYQADAGADPSLGGCAKAVSHDFMWEVWQADVVIN